VIAVESNQGQRVAVVTGGAGGIGSAIVARLAPEHTVVVLDRTGDVVVDLADPEDVRRAAGDVLDRHGRCDVFVHAAATFAFGPLEQVELDTWRQIQAVNVESALLLTQTPASVGRAEAEFADTEAHMALHRPLTPDDTAAVVAMLARDEAEALTGQTLTVDGGLVMR
jgi:NAD(P)-dependent dehydrogenase (short-subunit alcohol dehydrogenase family)